MGAVSDWVNMGELSRFRMWLLAIAVATLGAFRVGVLEKAVITLPAGQDLPSLLAGATGGSKATWAAALALLVAGALLAFIYASRQFRSDLSYTLGGVVTGLVVVGGWFVS